MAVPDEEFPLNRKERRRRASLERAAAKRLKKAVERKVRTYYERAKKVAATDYGFG